MTNLNEMLQIAKSLDEEMASVDALDLATWMERGAKNPQDITRLVSEAKKPLLARRPDVQKAVVAERERLAKIAGEAMKKVVEAVKAAMDAAELDDDEVASLFGDAGVVTLRLSESGEKGEGSVGRTPIAKVGATGDKAAAKATVAKNGDTLGSHYYEERQGGATWKAIADRYGIGASSVMAGAKSYAATNGLAWPPA